MRGEDDEQRRADRGEADGSADTEPRAAPQAPLDARRLRNDLRVHLPAQRFKHRVFELGTQGGRAPDRFGFRGAVELRLADRRGNAGEAQLRTRVGPARRIVERILRIRRGLLTHRTHTLLLSCNSYATLTQLTHAATHRAAKARARKAERVCESAGPQPCSSKIEQNHGMPATPPAR